MKNRLLIPSAFTRLLIQLALTISCFSAFADPIQPGDPVLSDQQFQACLDEALITNGWTTTEEVVSLSCGDRGIEFLGGVESLINLNQLDLSDNQLLDAHPLQMLNELTQLNLNGNSQLQAQQVRSILQNNLRLTHIGVGHIAMGDLSWLPPVGPMGEYDLVELDISYTGQFFDLGPLNQYPNLQVLKAAGNQIEFPTALDELRQLSVLDLSDNQLIDVFPLQLLNELTQLNLSGNSQLQAEQVRSIIQNNQGLTHIGVSHIAMGDLSWLPPVGPLGEYDLIDLDISYTGQLFDLGPLSQYPNLQVLKMAGNQIEYPSTFEVLTQLSVLDLSDNQLMDVYPLQVLNELTQLNLSGNHQLQAGQVQSIIQNNPGLTHIGVSHIAMGDLSWLPQMGPSGEYDLIDLDISYTGRLIDLGPLNQYSNLQVLKAAGNQTELLAALGELTQLSVLDLSDNLLIDVFTLQMLGELTQLRVLDLSDNQLIDAHPLQMMNELTQLNLSGNSQLQAQQVRSIIQNNLRLTHIGVGHIAMGDLSWLPPVGPLGEYDLLELDISYTGQFFDLAPLNQYRNLQVLKAAGNQIEFPTALDELTQLSVLDLSDNQLVDAYPLQILNELTQLNLSGNSQLQAEQVRSIIQNNPGLTHVGVGHIAMGDLSWLPPVGPLGEYDLIDLDISYTGQLFDLGALNQYPNLQVLKAAGNQIEFPTALDELRQLSVLDLSDNQLMDVYPLQMLNELTQLNLSGNSQLQAPGVQNVIQNNPKLSYIGVGHIAMGDLSWLPPVGPSGEYDLVELDISDTGQLIDLGPLTQYPNLEVLKAAGNQTELLAGLGELTQLRVLDLSDNLLIDVFTLQMLGELTQLRVLDLSDNQLIDAHPLQMMNELTQLNLSGNSQLQAQQVRSIIQNNPRLTHIGVGHIAMGDLSWLPPVGPSGEYDLIDLDISYTGQLFDLSPLNQYPNLQVLKVAGNQIEYLSTFDVLTQLSVLDLSNNQLMDVYPLQMSTQLTFLDLRGNNHLSCEQLDALEAQLPETILVKPESCIYLTPPDVSILSPYSMALYFETESVDFLAEAFDIEDGEISGLVEWTSSLDGLLGFGSSISLSISAGDHIITAKVVDSHGNAASTSVNLNVQPNSVPQLDIYAANHGDIFNEGDIVPLAGEAIDIEEGNISENIQWASSLDGLLGTGSFVQPQLSVGSHTITASITDSVNGTAVKTVTIVINALPTLTLQSPANGTVFMLQEAVEFKAIANDLEDGVISENIQWISNIDGVLGTGELVQMMSLGTHTITASIADSNNGTRSLTTQIVIEQIQLGITVSGNGKKRKATLSWSGARTPVDIYQDGVKVGAAESSGITSYRFKNQALFKVCEAGTNYCSIEILAQ